MRGLCETAPRARRRPLTRRNTDPARDTKAPQHADKTTTALSRARRAPPPPPRQEDTMGARKRERRVRPADQGGGAPAPVARAEVR